MSMLGFYKDKSIFITGHTGFKGRWLSRILRLAGANATGFALDDGGDIREFEALFSAFSKARPEIVFHLAAQPLVLDAFESPAYTFDVNSQGTVNLLECIRKTDSVKSAVIITTDKVYRNNEWEYGYRENDALGDIEPYAASKACAEIVIASYFETFLRSRGTAVSAARAGNVIGGGDTSANRIIPDCVRAAKKGEPVVIRNPFSVRPYQHVLEPLFAYLMIAEKQCGNQKLSGCYNIGPNEPDCVTAANLADIFCAEWGDSLSWIDRSRPGAVHESGVLKLDCSRIRSVFGWKPIWDIRKAVRKTIEWEKAEDKAETGDRQIEGYYAERANP
jgi:CDP-glucose 4,6-dehydratase